MEPYRVDFEKMDWESPMPGVRHRARGDRSKRLRLVEYSQAMEPHWCERGHTGVILAGTFEIEFKDGTQLFHSGDGVFIPAGRSHRHRARCLTAVVRAVFVEDR
jgi:hypothetical protein